MPNLKAITTQLTRKASEISNPKFVILSGFIGLFILLYMYGMVISISPGYVGVVFAKLGRTPKVEGRFIVEKGEKGYQREVLLPGWQFYWLGQLLWKYKISEEKMTLIKAQHVGLMKALDGRPMPKGHILAEDDFVDKAGVFHIGEKGPRLSTLSPGLHPINPKYIEVTEMPAVVIPSGKIGVVTRKVGETPPEGMVLVPKDSKYRGIQKEILHPGTHYINPLEKKVVLVEALVIQKGQVGILTKKIGKIPPAGTILVGINDEYQGIQREVLQPGLYYINPYAEEVKIVDAVVIEDGFVGVQVARTGKTKSSDRIFSKPGERGILEETLSPGIYYINPYEFEVIPFDTRQQRYEMTSDKNQGDTSGDDAINFLSDDGFNIQFDLTVVYQVEASNTPFMVATIGRDIDTIREKKIRPAARSFARIIGSKNRGEEFIHGIAREKFQSDLHQALTKKCIENNIIINQTLVRHFEVPQNLRDPIIKKVIALKLEAQYKQDQSTQKANADLSRQKQLITFESEKVKAETQKIKTIIAAEEKRDREKIMMEQKKFEAEGDAAKKKIHADASLYAARKEAEGIEVKLLAKAKGQKAMVEAWKGQGAQNIVASKLAEVLKGAQIIPLETLFGGGQKGGDGSIRYHNTIDLLNFFKLDTLVKGRKTGK